MVGWLWTEEQIKNSPSIQRGMSEEQEYQKRIEGCKVISQVGVSLGLKPKPTLATAAIYFHRFYMFHCFQDFQKELAALGCLFLAGKVEETPKKCKDICSAAIKNYPHLATRYRNLVEEVMGIERVLLRTLKFDLQVEHPYTFLPEYGKKLRNIDEEEYKNVLQTAWTFVNDSMSTTICLQWEPEVIAIALIHLALTVKNLEKRISSGSATGSAEENWWDELVFQLTKELITVICHKVLDFYTLTRQQSNNGHDAQQTHQ